MAKPPGGKSVRRNKEEGQSMQRGGGSRSMQQGGGPVYAKPRSLTCTDFEYVFTILTSANICCASYYCMPIPALQLPLYTHRYSLTISPSFCFVACALYTIVIRFILANCLLLNLLCCALESRPSCSSMQSITCFNVTASCRTQILWIITNVAMHLAPP